MSSFFESVFVFLFKYSPYVYEQGRFVLSASWPVIVFALVLLTVAAPAVLRYGKVRAKSRPVDRAVLAGLRIATLSILLFCMFQPSLVVSTAVPQENFVGILIDDSRSMQIADRADEPRSAFVEQNFGNSGTALMEALEERFKVRFFRFSDTVERLNGITDLNYTGNQTNLGRALDGARQELFSVPLSGLVLVTDGADNSMTGLTDSLQTLRASSVPVFPVGLGLERFDRDIEIARVEAPRSVLEGSTVAADVVIEHKGFEGSTVLLLVEDSQGIVSTQEVELPRQGDSTVVKAHFTADDPGPNLFQFRIARQEGEMVAENNQRDGLITVQDRRDKILYFEGEPRHEVGFMKRAVQDDENLQLVLLQRTAENKFHRVGVDDADELFAGFPTTREELYRYRGLILGSVEADFFTADQKQMIVDYVSRRGGGFMMLGGRNSFAEGGWANSPVAEILPVILDATQRSPDTPDYTEVQVELTLFGKTHPVTQVADTVEESIERWGTLPGLTIRNRVVGAKPGASTILTGARESRSEPQAILTYQRYGRGKVLAFLPVDSWLWQMHFEIPLEDITHETLWRQLLRWLVNDAAGQVELRTSAERFAPRQVVTLTAAVKDDTYIEVNNAEVIARIETPLGNEIELPMDWTVETDGEYRATFTPEELGFHEISVIARRDGGELGQDTGYIEVANFTHEYFGAEMQSSLLRRIAEETGGRFYTPEMVSSLPGDIGHSEGGTTVLEVKDLWDMPALFLLLVVLVATEWSYRKLKGLA